MKIIVICLGDEWGAKERRAIADCLLFSGQGYSAFLLCSRDSFIHDKALREGVTVLLHKGPVLKSSLRQRGFSLTLDHFTELHGPADLFNCYSHEVLWFLSFYLVKRKIKSALVYNYLENEDTFKGMGFIKKSLFRRIDHIFVPLKSKYDLLLDNLSKSISHRRFSFLGMGVPIIREKMITWGQTNPVDCLYLGLAIDVSLHSIDQIIPFLQAFSNILEVNTSKKSPKLLLISEEKWDKRSLFLNLVDWVQMQQLEQDILFEHVDDIYPALASIDILIDISPSTHIPQDFTVSAQMMGISTLLARSAYSLGPEFFNEAKIKRYRNNDAREIRSKLLELINKHTTKKKNFKFSKQFQSVEEFNTSYLEQINRIVKRRVRMHKKIANNEHNT